jgi:hypothetical protein
LVQKAHKVQEVFLVKKARRATEEQLAPQVRRVKLVQEVRRVKKAIPQTCQTMLPRLM